jgi:hypothetical protein
MLHPTLEYTLHSLKLGHTPLHLAVSSDRCVCYVGGQRVFNSPMLRGTSCAYDWPFVPVDSPLLLDNIQKLIPYVPENQRAHMLSSWTAFAKDEDSASASMCHECTSLRAASKAADSAVYQLGPAHHFQAMMSRPCKRHNLLL